MFRHLLRLVLDRARRRIDLGHPEISLGTFRLAYRLNEAAERARPWASDQFWKAA
jgi:hypothetical protein